MTSSVIWDGVRELIKQYDLLAAAELLEKWLKGRLHTRKVNAWLDELIIHVASAKAVLLRGRAGLISKEEEGVELRRISRSLLDLLREIESEDSTPNLPSVVQLPNRYREHNFEKIIGNRSQLQKISWLERGIECSKAVCRLSSRTIIGTGFLVQRNLIITNHHVVPSSKDILGFYAEFFFEEDLDGKIKNIVNVGLDPKRFWASEVLDISVIGIHADSLDQVNTIAPLPLKSSSAASVGDFVAIIQHPLGGPKQIALAANEVINIYGHRVQYTTDTLPGSSGAPVFNMSWDVVAIHHAGGDLLMNRAGDKIFANEGISIDFLLSQKEAERFLSQG